MKIVGVDNFDRETEADYLVAENIRNEEMANVMVKALNDKYCSSDHSPIHYVVKPDDYRLSKGMADLI